MASAIRTAALLAALLLPTGGLADDFEQGKAAYLANDYSRALGILRPLAEAGDPRAQVTLGMMYDHGHGVSRDGEAATNWYERAAEQDLPAVQHDLAVRYFRGTGIPQNYAKAAYWWQRAAENDLAESQYNLALMLSRGLAIEQDDERAVHWYRAAAEQGHAQAQYSLAVMYAFGQGVDLDYGAAARWFRQAAEAGVAQAQYNLGILYEHGRGLDADPQQARRWYESAAEQGLEQAVQKLAMLPAPAPPAPQAPQADPPPPRDPPTSVAAADGNGSDIRGVEWIAAQDPNHFTLQIATANDEQSMLRFLRRTGLAGDLAYFTSRTNGRTRYAAVYGVFQTIAEAERALAALPEHLQTAKPWIRKFSVIQQIGDQP